MKTVKLFLAATFLFAASAIVSAQDTHKHEGGCCSKDKTDKVAVKKVDSQDSADKNAKTKIVTFNVNMHCDACKAKIDKNIRWEKGVKDMKVDLDSKTVKITYDPKKTSEDDLKKAIEKLKFTCAPEKG